MKIALFYRFENPFADDFRSQVEALGIAVEVNPCLVEGCDMAISFGGDGTFLGAVRNMGAALVPILGINSGRLGFLATVSKEQGIQAVQAILEGRYQLERRTLLNVHGLGVALNEFTIQKRGTAMVKIEVGIDRQPVASYWADGVIVSTPTGSTAYSMSVGGAILAPDCPGIIVSPIAPHNLNIRPLVVSEASKITITISSRDGGTAAATIDNREFEAFSGDIYDIEMAAKRLEIIKLAGSGFYNTLREKLYWGVDLRN